MNVLYADSVPNPFISVTAIKINVIARLLTDCLLKRKYYFGFAYYIIFNCKIAFPILCLW